MKNYITLKEIKKLEKGAVIDIRSLKTSAVWEDVKVIENNDKFITVGDENVSLELSLKRWDKDWAAWQTAPPPPPMLPCVKWVKEYQRADEDYRLRVTFDTDAPRPYTIEVCSRWSEYLTVPYSIHIHTRKRLNEYLSSIHNGYRTLEEIWKEAQVWVKNNG